MHSARCSQLSFDTQTHYPQDALRKAGFVKNHAYKVVYVMWKLLDTVYVSYLYYCGYHDSSHGTHRPEMVKFTKQNPPCETNSCCTSQEIPSLLWNLVLHHRVNASLSLKPFLIFFNSAHSNTAELSLTLIIKWQLSGLTVAVFGAP
jgi:hypothetical protein